MDLAKGLRDSGVGGAAGPRRPLGNAVLNVYKGLKNSKLNVFRSARKFNNRYHKPELDKTPSAPRPGSGSFIKFRSDTPKDNRIHQRSDTGPPGVNNPREIGDVGPMSSVQASKGKPQSDIKAQPVQPVSSNKSKGDVRVTTKPLGTKVSHKSSPIKPLHKKMAQTKPTKL